MRTTQVNYALFGGDCYASSLFTGDLTIYFVEPYWAGPDWWTCGSDNTTQVNYVLYGGPCIDIFMVGAFNYGVNTPNYTVFHTGS